RSLPSAPILSPAKIIARTSRSASSSLTSALSPLGSLLGVPALRDAAPEAPTAPRQSLTKRYPLNLSGDGPRQVVREAPWFATGRNILCRSMLPRKGVCQRNALI